MVVSLITLFNPFLRAHNSFNLDLEFNILIQKGLTGAVLCNDTNHDSLGFIQKELWGFENIGSHTFMNRAVMNIIGKIIYIKGTDLD